ncbi:hypothetical protein WS71_25615 [Burkholderia mayonis]|uniref:Uncharacterized protein n=1 Tax=Burkholderia mayonis TaxID=1385591 RepID=A0A1B4G3T1_9BURK|nr:hypothetical protein WS71_25615 [Burkholderia mayonis]
MSFRPAIARDTDYAQVKSMFALMPFNRASFATDTPGSQDRGRKPASKLRIMVRASLAATRLGFRLCHSDVHQSKHLAAAVRNTTAA